MSDTVTTVTSENMQDFRAKRMGWDVAPASAPGGEDATPKPSEEPSAVEQAPESTDETPESPEDAGKPGEEGKHKNPKIERRFSELTAKRREAEAAAEAAREEARLLKEKLAQYEKPAESTQKDEAPKPESYTDPFEYARDLADYAAKQALAKRDAEEEQRKANEAQQAVMQSWNEKLENARKEFADFDEMVQSSDVQVSDQVRDAILDSDLGPQILYYLADNSDEAKKIAGMSVAKALRELGKIEAKLEKKPEPVDKQQQPAKVASKAPAPISPIRGVTASQDAKVSAAGEFTGTYAEFKALRKAGKL